MNREKDSVKLFMIDISSTLVYAIDDYLTKKYEFLVNLEDCSIYFIY